MGALAASCSRSPTSRPSRGSRRAAAWTPAPAPASTTPTPSTTRDPGAMRGPATIPTASTTWRTGTTAGPALDQGQAKIPTATWAAAWTWGMPIPLQNFMVLFPFFVSHDRMFATQPFPIHSKVKYERGLNYVIRLTLTEI